MHLMDEYTLAICDEDEVMFTGSKPASKPTKPTSPSSPPVKLLKVQPAPTIPVEIVEAGKVQATPKNPVEIVEEDSEDQDQVLV